MWPHRAINSRVFDLLCSAVDASLQPVDADAGSVAVAIVGVIDTPFGKRPFRVHVDPSHDGAEVVNGVADRVRAEMFWRIGLEDLLHPAVISR